MSDIPDSMTFQGRQTDFVPPIVQGELARILASEITRKATNRELAVLVKAQANRVPRKENGNNRLR